MIQSDGSLHQWVVGKGSETVTIPLRSERQETSHESMGERASRLKGKRVQGCSAGKRKQLGVQGAERRPV